MANKRISQLATTITAFRTGDVLPVDGPSGTAKMGKDDLLQESAQNTLAGNVAPAFDPTKPNGDDGFAYHSGDVVEYEGKTYAFKVNHVSGAWDASEVIRYVFTDAVSSADNSKAYLGIDIKCVGNDTTQVYNSIELIVGKTYVVTSRKWQAPTSGVALNIVATKTDGTTENLGSSSAIPYGSKKKFTLPSTGYTGQVSIRVRAALGTAVELVVSSVDSSAHFDIVEKKIQENNDKIAGINSDLVNNYTPPEKTIPINAYDSSYAYSMTIGSAPVQESASNYESYIVKNLSVGDRVIITGAFGSSYSWGKVSEGLVVGFLSGTPITPHTDSVYCDGTFDSIVVNLYKGSQYGHDIKIVKSTRNFLGEIVVPEYTFSSELKTGLRYTTNIGEAPAEDISDNFQSLILNVAEGDVIEVHGKTGSTYRWAKVSEGLVSEIVNIPVTTELTKTIYCDGTFDSLVLNFYQYSTAVPSVKITRSINGFLESIPDLIEKGTKKKLNILLIGNSYGICGIGQVPVLLRALGIDCNVVDIFRGSGSIADMEDSITNDTTYGQAAYVNDGGVWRVLPDAYKKIQNAIKLYDYDVVIINQKSSDDAGGTDYTWTNSISQDLDVVTEYIRKNTNGTPAIYYYGSFAKQMSSNNYDRDTQCAQTNATIAYAEAMQKRHGLKWIPTCTAVQNARMTSLAQVIMSSTKRDLIGEGTHLDGGYGGYILGCSIVEKLVSDFFGMSVEGVKTIPTHDESVLPTTISTDYYTQITESDALIARCCAIAAVRSPSTINTEIAERFPQL